MANNDEFTDSIGNSDSRSDSSQGTTSSTSSGCNRGGNDHGERFGDHLSRGSGSITGEGYCNAPDAAAGPPPDERLDQDRFLALFEPEYEPEYDPESQAPSSGSGFECGPECGGECDVELLADIAAMLGLERDDRFLAVADTRQGGLDRARWLAQRIESDTLDDLDLVRTMMQLAAAAPARLPSADISDLRAVPHVLSVLDALAHRGDDFATLVQTLPARQLGVIQALLSALASDLGFTTRQYAIAAMFEMAALGLGGSVARWRAPRPGRPAVGVAVDGAAHVREPAPRRARRRSQPLVVPPGLPAALPEPLASLPEPLRVALAALDPEAQGVVRERMHTRFFESEMLYTVPEQYRLGVTTVQALGDDAQWQTLAEAVRRMLRGRGSDRSGSRDRTEMQVALTLAVEEAKHLQARPVPMGIDEAREYVAARYRIAGPHMDALFEAHAQEVLAVRDGRRVPGARLLFHSPHPGNGKSQAAMLFAEITGRPVHKVNCSGVHSTHQYVGLDPAYQHPVEGHFGSAARCGRFNAVILEQIDMHQEYSGERPVESLLLATDPTHNQRFSLDLLLPGFHADLHHTMWVATSNDLSTIPTPLLDRFEVIEFPALGDDDKRAILVSFSLPKARRHNGLADDFVLADPAIDVLVARHAHEGGMRGPERDLDRLARQAALAEAQGTVADLSPAAVASLPRLERPISVVSGPPRVEHPGTVRIPARCADGRWALIDVDARVTRGGVAITGLALGALIEAAGVGVEAVCDDIEERTGARIGARIHVNAPDDVVEVPWIGAATLLAVASAFVGRVVPSDGWAVVAPSITGFLRVADIDPACIDPLVQAGRYREIVVAPGALEAGVPAVELRTVYELLDHFGLIAAPGIAAGQYL